MDFADFAERFREHTERRLAAFEVELNKAREQSTAAQQRQQRFAHLEALADDRRRVNRRANTGPVRGILQERF